MSQKRPLHDPPVRGTVYLHFPCFDGVVSSVLASEFLERSLGWQIQQFEPVNYDRMGAWLATPLDQNAAVVDFLYHPQASFWADHHATSFLDPSHQTIVAEARDRHLYYDRTCQSCSLLLWQNLHAELDDSVRLADMVYWANKIDSATYENVDEAIFGTTAAMDISLSLIVENGTDYCDLLVRSLRAQTLDEVAGLPRVHQAAENVRNRMRAGLQRVRNAISLRGDIAICDVIQPKDAIISRYSPYYVMPDARYSLMLVRSSDHAKITAMRNPWLNFESIELGRIFKPFGGGGHQRVASVFLPPDRMAHADELMRQIADAIYAEEYAATKASFA
jgi:hypothetical protein